MRELFAEQRFARLLATAAGFGADAAVFHLRAVLFALRAAALAGLDAGAELRAGEFEICPGKTGDDPRGDEADVGAIADALHHLGDVLFAEAGVGVGVAASAQA